MTRSNKGLQAFELLLFGAMALCVGIFITLAFENEIANFINSNSNQVIAENNSSNFAGTLSHRGQR